MSNNEFNDQAVAILRHTSDGDDLDGRDLALVQDVVNSGGHCLSSPGLTYWHNLVERCKNGEYVRRPYCGVPGLTRDSEGYVYWKGRNIEHYSFRDRDAEIVAARKLGAVCLALEARGEQVLGRSVMGLYDEMHFGDGIESPRFAMYWTIEKAGPRCAVCPIQAINHKDAQVEEAARRNHFKELWGADNGLRCSVIRHKQDFELTVQGFASDERWARGQFWEAYNSGRAVETLMGALSKDVDINVLAGEDDFVQKIIGEHLMRSTTLSEQHLALEAQAMSGERPRERSAG